MGFLLDLADWPFKTFPGLRKSETLGRLTSKTIFRLATKDVPPRPHPFSLAADFTTWTGLVDRRYTGRHLAASSVAARPDAETLLRLSVAEPGKTEACIRSTLLFAAFAQWFTDSFLRTFHGLEFDGDGNAIPDPATGSWKRQPDRHRYNDSNHEIDLCQIYGLSEEKTRLLRLRSEERPGLLAHQEIDGEVYPRFLLTEPPVKGRPLAIHPDFEGLHDERLLRAIFFRVDDREVRSTQLFAVGLEHGNATIGNSLLNTLFLREHNRVAEVIAADNPGWDDERVFQTARNVLIVMLLKIVISHYIGHIMPQSFPLIVVPGYAEQQRWYRPNRISIEFNLLYRWHELVPETFDFLETPEDFRHNNGHLIERGVEAVVEALSSQRAGKITLGNLPQWMAPIKRDTISLMRAADLASYNAYRERFGFEPVRRFEEITRDPARLEALQRAYPDGVDSLEWFVGMYAEDHSKGAIMGDLMMAMVANDAFTQALTNPLLANDVFVERTFSAAGMAELEKTNTLCDLIRRNVRTPDLLCTFDAGDRA